MIYRDFEITATAPEYHFWGVEDDGTIDTSDYRGSSDGCDLDNITYDIRETEQTGEAGELITGDYMLLANAKKHIDSLVEERTTFKDERGN